MKDHGPEIHSGCRYVLFVIDNFSKIGWTKASKKAQSIKDDFEIIHTSSKTKPRVIETAVGKNIDNKILQDILSVNSIKIYSRNTSLGAVLQNALVVRSECSLKRLVLKKEMVTGLIY